LRDAIFLFGKMRTQSHFAEPLCRHSPGSVAFAPNGKPASAWHRITLPTLTRAFRNLLGVSATVAVQEQEVIVKLDKHAHNPFLVSSGLADQPAPMPWCGGKPLVIQFA
jgi:hypothetical protein